MAGIIYKSVKYETYSTCNKRENLVIILLFNPHRFYRILKKKKITFTQWNFGVFFFLICIRGLESFQE